MGQSLHSIVHGNLLKESLELNSLSNLTFRNQFYYINMPRGGKRGHKGGRKQFSNPQALEAAKAKEAKEKEWRRQRGEVITDSEDEEDDDDKKDSDSDNEAGGVAFKKESSESESESESEDEERRPKGAEGLIEIANPNRVQQMQKKVTALGDGTSGGKPQLSR